MKAIQTRGPRTSSYMLPPLQPWICLAEGNDLAVVGAVCHGADEEPLPVRAEDRRPQALRTTGSRACRRRRRRNGRPARPWLITCPPSGEKTGSQTMSKLSARWRRPRPPSSVPSLRTAAATRRPSAREHRRQDHVVEAWSTMARRPPPPSSGRSRSPPPRRGARRPGSASASTAA